MTNKKIKGVFFDLYGTLLTFNDFDGSDAIWVNSFYKLVGEPNGISYDTVQQICRGILESDLEKNASTNLTTYETKIKTEFEKVGVNLTADELRKVADETISIWQKEIHLADDALLVLGELKENCMIILITNFDHSPHVKKLLERTGLQNYFDLVIISDEAGCKKPNPEIFNLALDRTRLKPEEVIYVGDNILDDICGASSAGIRPVLISRGTKSNQIAKQEQLNLENFNLPEHQIIKSLSELIPFVN